MIIAVGLNPAMDLTYELHHPVRSCSTNRVESVALRPGGKALNVARVLHGLGRPVRVVGLAGGPTGRQLADDAADLGIEAHWIPVSGETRRTIALHEASTDRVTMLNEPGPCISPDEWSRALDVIASLPQPDALILSGSLPPGVPDTAYGQIIDTLKPHHVLTVLDTDGRGLLPGVEAGPDIAKPNRAELAAADGTDENALGTAEAVRSAADRLRRRGAGAVVATIGSGGLVGVTEAGAWRVTPPRVDAGNPTGAGDACVAGLVASTLDGQTWPERLRVAAALGAAAVLTPFAGELADVESLLARTIVEELT